MPPPSPLSSTPGAALRERRLELGKRQEDLANDAEVSQKLISELERGEQELTAVGIGRVSNIARALDWTLNDLQIVTGLDFAIDAPTPPASADAVRPGNVSSVPPQKPLRPIPPELQEMIDEKSSLDPDLLTERWQQYLAGQRFSTGAVAAERWWNLYLTLKNAGIEPGGN